MKKEIPEFFWRVLITFVECILPAVLGNLLEADQLIGKPILIVHKMLC